MSKFKLNAVLILIALILAVSPMLTRGGDTKTDDAKTLRHIKEVLWPKAYREQDGKLLDRILAKEFRMIAEDGKWYTKADEMEYIKKNKPSYDSFKFIIKRLDIFENGTAVVAGMGVIEATDKKGPHRIEYMSSNILIKRNGQWKAISSHVSGVKRIDKKK